MFQDTHNSAVAKAREEILLHVVRVVEVDEFAIFHDGTDAEVRVFTAAGYAVDRFSLEGNFEAVFTEYFADDNTGEDFVISRLNGIACVFPVDFQLFKNVNEVTGIIDLCFDTANFFMAHFRFETVLAEAFYRLFQSRTNDAVRTLPVLFLELLGNGQAARCYVLARALNPEFQFCCCREDDLFDVVCIDGQAVDAIFFNNLDQFVVYIIQCIAQDGTGIDIARSMAQEARNTQGTGRFACVFVNVVVVIVNNPVYARIGFDIYAGIGQCRNARQYNRGTVGLESCSVEEVIIIFKECRDRNLFICVIPSQVDTYEGNEFDFRMLFEKG